MALTSTEPSGFPIKPVVTVLAAVAFVAGVYAISQQFWTDSQPSASAPTGAVIETAEPYTGPSGLSEAYAAGKFDAGLNPVRSEASAVSEPAPEVIVIEGQGSLYDGLVEGQYDVGSLSGAHDVLSSEAAVASSGLTEALASGKLDAGFAPQPSEATIGSEPAPQVVVVEGHGALYDALVDGKYNQDFTSGDPGVQYLRRAEASTSAGGLTEAVTTGQLAEGFGDRPSVESAPAATDTPTVSGGHQE